MELVENQSSIIDLGPHLKFYFKLMLRCTLDFHSYYASRPLHKGCAKAVHQEGPHGAS
ncbi:hypothetical protein CNECB9_1360025 [Cupriavidus necator]|uniref:Uncharacterized protein n=1 Tax=Cupriavidus necator TaxID=106590 RepID=A0A1K0I9F6_CUPNE|nr:hypothetical protein CNECB9_1360025 [Cupriavidus necator]